MAKKKKGEEEPLSGTNAPAESPFLQSITEAISGMIYISESEAPLDLQAWTDVTDLASLQAKINTRFAVSLEAQTQVPADEFLNTIQQMADPSDPVMVDYASRYVKLFTLLKAGGADVAVIRAAAEQLHIFIAAFGENGSAVIHTTAVET